MENTRTNKTQDDFLTLKELLPFLWRLRFWMLLSTVLAVAGAYVALKFVTPVYKRTTQIMLASKNSGSTEISILSDISGMGQTFNIDNEILILQSHTLMSNVIDALHLNYRYYSKGASILIGGKTDEYYKDSPFELRLAFDSLYFEKSFPSFLKVSFVPVDADTYILKDVSLSSSSDVNFDEDRLYKWGDSFSQDGVTFTINPSTPFRLDVGTQYIATWTAPFKMAMSYSDKFTAIMEKGTSKYSRTDVITLSMEDTKAKRAEDILNAIIKKYNEESRTYKTLSVVKTIEFIDSRLGVLAKDLSDVESSVLNYQSSNTLVNLGAQSQLVLSSDMGYENQLTEVRLQSAILKMIKEEMNDMRAGEYRVLPSNIGLSDVNLSGVISNYNILVAERSRMVANSSEANPRVLSLNQQLADARSSIFISIDNLEKVYRIREDELNGVLRKSKQKMSTIPIQQFDLTQIERKQQILEPLYLLLQQKKEEAQVSLYSVDDKARVIEKVYGPTKPISPKSSQVLLLALILGCCFPPGLVWLLRTLRTSVQSREDIEEVLDVPILATIPVTKDISTIRNSASRDIKSESFRMLRSNLKFLKDARVIQVTSSTPGEGKSFVASNLAVSVAHTGKKVALLGLDLRKPALVERFDGMKVDRKNSVVSYLIGSVDDLSIISQSCPFCENLQIAFSGSLPPNPTEILSSDRLGSLIEWFKERYDYVILDTAPMMPVSDSLLINKYVDYTLYVIRAQYTQLKMLSEIKLLFEQAHIVSPKIVLNGMNFESNSMKYGYGSRGCGYGNGHQGYGYGYGYGYGDYEDSDDNGGHIRRIINSSKKKFNRRKKES